LLFLESRLIKKDAAMLRRTIFTFVLCWLFSGSAFAQGTVEDYKRSERFGFYHLRSEITNLIFKTKVEPHWFDGGPDANQKFWYRNDIRDGGKEFIVVDTEAGTRGPAFDHQKLAKALSKQLKAKYQPDKLPFNEIAFVQGGNSIEFVLEKNKWQCDLTSYECKIISSVEPNKPNEEKSQQSEKSETGLSPDAKWEAFFREYNLYLKKTDSNQTIQLTNDGNESCFYSSPVWSPDSKKLVCSRVEKGSDKKMYYIEPVVEGQIEPKLHEYVYPLPGDKIEVKRIVLFDIEKERQLTIDDSLFSNPYFLTSARWKRDSSSITIKYVQRGWQVIRLTEIDAHSGKVRPIVEDKTDTGALGVCSFEYFIEDSNEIIWASERDGWNHLYLFDRPTGKVKRQLTAGQWVVRDVEFVDEKNRHIFFASLGREQGRDPYLAHYYRVNKDSGEILLLTPGNGEHSVQFSPDRRFFIDTYSRADLAPITELRRTSDGGLVCLLEEADIELLEKTGWKMPEPFVAKGRDGKTDIHGLVYRPSNLDPSKKYPVIEKIYNGPHWFHCPKSFEAALKSGLMQPLAELGFVTVIIDGMGTAGRSKAFRDVSHRNLGDAGLPDHIAWLKALAKQYPYVDISRVGIFGYSAGGYDSARALIAHPESYKAAVSLAGNHDHRLDKLSWNEQWMGYPVGDYYNQQSNVTNAGKLKGKLLLICGCLDTNVPHESTLKLADALIKANKNFEMFIHPGTGHNLGDDYTSRKIEDFFVRNLMRVELAEGNAGN
jgi:dipeptidyl aminopeptidase/acylaminoacyl peptidase